MTRPKGNGSKRSKLMSRVAAAAVSVAASSGAVSAATVHSPDRIVPASESRGIMERIEAVRDRIRAVENSPTTAGARGISGSAAEKIAQWPNWTNWPNWSNGWGNWMNWRNY